MAPKDLDALLKLLRRAGVTEYTSPELSLKLGPLPTRTRAPRWTKATPLVGPGAIIDEPDDHDPDDPDAIMALERRKVRNPEQAV